jgi:hypothetical protein
MLSKIIKITNSPQFIQKKSIVTKSVKMTLSTLEMDFQIVDNWTEQVYYQCRLYAEGLGHSIDHRMHQTGAGNYQFNLYQDHPSLWLYQKSSYYSLFGPVEDLSTLIGDLYLVHAKVCGNWIDFHRLIFGLEKRLSTGLETGIELPEALSDYYLEIFHKYNLKYTLKNNRKVSDPYQVLIVGNDAITTDDLNLGQPYLVAEKFTATID